MLRANGEGALLRDLRWRTEAGEAGVDGKWLGQENLGAAFHNATLWKRIANRTVELLARDSFQPPARSSPELKLLLS